MDGSQTAAEITRQARQLLERRPEVLFGYVFGSSARGDTHAHSDVDIAVFIDVDLVGADSGTYRAELLTELSCALRRNDVDLVILNYSPVVLQQRVLRDGAMITSKDERIRVAFTTDTLRKYVDTAPLRRLALEHTQRSIRDGTFGREVSVRGIHRQPDAHA